MCALSTRKVALSPHATGGCCILVPPEIAKSSRYAFQNPRIKSQIYNLIFIFSSSTPHQVKGVSYSLEDFLGPPTWNDKDSSPTITEKIKQKSPDNVLYQCVIYLAPGDYHRFHSPVAWKPEIRRHFSGELLSVSPNVAKWVPGLFCLNERALYIGKWTHGFFSFTAVGKYL